MKKLLSLLLVLAVFIPCFFACNFGKNNDIPNGGTNIENPDTPDEPDAPDVPDTPDTPDKPDEPDTPVVPTPHEHIYSTEWTYDSENHWHKAVCSDNAECATATADLAAHTPKADGKCDCGYEKHVDPKPDEPEEPKAEILGSLVSDYGIILSNGTKIDANYYPGFVRKALTFTIDDGNMAMDKSFLDIVRPAGIKGTFNLCAADAKKTAELLVLYEGYEVANHNWLHCLTYRDDFDYSKIEIKDEVFNSSTANGTYMYKDAEVEGLYYIDYRHYNSSYDFAYWHPIASNETYVKYVELTTENIESVFGDGSVVGYAYPHGSVNEYVKQYLKDAGYLYARDTGLLIDKTGFSLPADRFEWTYNADNSNLLAAMALYDAYVDDGNLKFFSFGVHSADYKNSWDMLAEFAETYGNRSDEFYYATNREIFEYEDAVKALVITEDRVTNPSDIAVYLTVNNVKIILPAGATYMFEPSDEIPEYEITFEDVSKDNLPSSLTVTLNSTVAKNVGVLISEVTKGDKSDRVFTLTSGPDGADVVTVRRTLRRENYEAVTFKSDILLDTDSKDGCTFFIRFKNTTGKVVYQLTMGSDDEGKIGFDDYYRYNDKGIWTVSKSSTGLTRAFMGRWFNIALEVSKNDEGNTVLRIIVDNSLVAECTHEAFLDVDLEEYASVEITSDTATSCTLNLDNVSLRQTERIVTEKAKDDLAEIMPVKGGANGIIILVHDDGDLPSVERLDALYAQYGLVGDVALIANRVWDTETGAPIVDKQEKWKTYLYNGRWGLINHSLTHNFAGEYDENGFIVDKDVLYDEIVTSGDILRNLFPNQRVLTYAYPGYSSITNVHGKYPTMKDSVSLVTEHYIGARNYKGGTQAIDKLIYSFTNGKTLGGGASDMEQIDETAKDGTHNILVYLMHQVMETNLTSMAIHVDAARATVERISDHVMAGKVWNAHFEDALLYLSESESATVKSTVNGDTILLDVNDGLDDEIYNYPLTVKLKVSSEWEAVKLTQGERTVYAVAFEENGSSYVYLDVVPDGGEATVVSVAKSDVPEEFIPVVVNPHEHTYSDTYSYNNANHWRAAICDDRIACAEAVVDLEVHVFNDDDICYCGYEKPEAPDTTKPELVPLGYYAALGGYNFDSMTNATIWRTLDKPGIIQRPYTVGLTCGLEDYEISESGHFNAFAINGNMAIRIGTGTKDIVQKYVGPMIDCFIPASNGNLYVFESNVYFGICNMNSDLSALSFEFLDADGVACTSRKIYAVSQDGNYLYDCFGTLIAAETYVNIAIEYDPQRGTVKYYLNGNLAITDTVETTIKTMSALRLTSSRYAKNYVVFDNMHFSCISSNITENDEYYTFSDGKIPEGFIMDKKSEGGAMCVDKVITESALKLTTTSGGDDRFYFDIADVASAKKIVLETKYLVNATVSDGQVFEFLSGGNRVSYITLTRYQDGSVVIADYFKLNGVAAYSFSNITLTDVPSGWMDIKLIGYETDDEGFYIEIYINGELKATSKNTHWVSTKIADIDSMRYYTYSNLDADIYFDDFKLVKVAD